ncbi:cyclase family protein [Corynebacterium otitidis]|uniref:Cyclase family protein n=1 Tax=Corynebacterium otitidis ATCC 51513 TaxID=883169 RepID=I7JVS9_9CORY|nr:cyclase family protein [Corynebacterium otitidis]EJZ82061.1 hypothetical protein HMPREF9719_01044 [Corynebacterium otitidis ATCC 51513]KKO82978.1 cyclase [Corynebacterium otitidis]CCI83246.1 hypothetical protein BN46_0507 [Corynebacterium otitidis ATCC 51513]
MDFVHLSHVLRPGGVAFPGEPTLGLRQDRARGDEQGSEFAAYTATLPGHVGTHMDGPRHHRLSGPSFDELPMRYFAYEGEEIALIDLPHRDEPASVVTRGDLEAHREEIAAARLLLIRTGFEARRDADPETYCERGVSLHPEACRWLSEECPRLDCVGMDWLSVGSPTNDYGTPAHRWLLGCRNDHLITAVEDMSLAPLGRRRIEFLTLGPLRLAGVDSAQVAAIAALGGETDGDREA